VAGHYAGGHDSKAAGVGYESMAEHNMRPTAGNQAAYSFYQGLLDYARRGVDTVNYSARFNPHPVVLRPNGSGRLVGTTTIEFLENVDSYSIDQTMLPADTTIDGNTYRNGDTVTVTAPLEDIGKTYTTYDIFHLNSKRSPANVFWYEPDGGNLQKMVVYDMSFQPASAISLTITCEDGPQTGIIYLNKSNRDISKGNYSLAGAVYRVFERNTGKSVADITTDANGNAQTGPLPLVDYLVWEVAAPYGFLLDDTYYTAYFTEAGAAQIYISAGDTPQQGKITVKKTNANTAMGDYSLQGAVFEIFSGSALVDTITTDASGSAQSKALNLGNYTVKEKTAPSGYVLNTASFPAKLEYAGENVQLAAVSVTVPEQPQAGVIRVNKTNANAANGEYSLAGAVFEIRNSGGTLVDTITTDAQGKAQTKQLPLGSYMVKEKTAPAGFQRDTNEYTANLTYGGQDTAVVYADVNVPEQPQMGRINIKKTNATPALGDYPLSGAVFEIFNGSTLVDTVTTNAAGEAQSKALKLGSYTVKEKTAPFGYVLNTDSFTANLEYAGQDVELSVVSVTVPEQPQRGIIHINKTNADAVQGNYSLEGAVFEIRTEGGVLVDTVTTDASGKASSKELPLGAYAVAEKSAPYGFLRDKNEYDAVLTYAGQDIAVTACTVNVPEKPQTGKINIKKTNATPALGDYSLQGAVFEIFSGSTLVDTLTTNAAGEAQSKALKLGSYTVKEKTAPFGYVLNADSFTAKLEYAGQDVELAVVSVTVPEEPQRGIIRVAKANANPSMGDYSLQGAVFEIRDSQGKLVDTITTNANGQANSKELPLGSYTVSEKTAPQGFVRNRNIFGAQLSYAGQTVTVVYADVAVAEQPQVGTITVTKKDAATGSTAQGDSILAGAVFEVYKSDKSTLVDTLYCGTGNTATTKELPLGTYYVQEKTPPVGYTLDEEFHQVKLEYAGQEIEVTSTSYDLKNKVIQGQIAITKHIDAPMEGYDDPQIEQPLEGAVFQVYLAAAGSYDAAKESERDLITTNENGFAITKKLPYGLYTVAEIEAPGDFKMVDPFQVFISQEGKIYRFILNNITFRSQVKVIKVDAETGKPILLAGTTFKVKDLSTGKFIVQHVDYPTPADISEFETAPDGTLVLPEPLKSGEYELVEVLASRGYLLSDKPVKFTVHSSQAEETITVTMENKPVMGKVKVEKTGNMLVGAKEIETIFGSQYLPLFEMKFLLEQPDGVRAGFSGRKLDGLYLGGMSFPKAVFAGTVMEHCNLDEGDFTESDFREAALFDVTAFRAELDFTDFSGARLTDCVFRQADLVDACFADAVVKGCVFDLANTKGADFTQAELVECDGLDDIAQGLAMTMGGM